MPTLPRKPRPGDSPKVLAGILSDLIDYCRCTTPKSSADIRVSTVLGGTLLSLNKKPSTSARGSGGSGTWSGIVWYLGELTLDFSKVGNEPEGEVREFGMYGVQTVEGEDGPVRTYQGSVTGCYLKIEMVSGEATFTDAIDDDVDEYNYYPVAQVIDQDDEENNIYSALSGRTVGDVRVDSVPYHEPIEEEEETGT